MTLADVFDKLLEHRKIAVCVNLSAANTLRVSLLRKFKDYKQQTAALGWLSDEFEQAVVSLEYDATSGTATYYLRPRKRAAIEYTLLSLPGEDQNDDQ